MRKLTPSELQNALVGRYYDATADELGLGRRVRIASSPIEDVFEMKCCSKTLRVSLVWRRKREVYKMTVEVLVLGNLKGGWASTPETLLEAIEEIDAAVAGSLFNWHVEPSRRGDHQPDVGLLPV